MPQKRTTTSTGSKQSASRGQQLASRPKPAASKMASDKTSSKMSTKSQATREQASKAADAGAAPEQLDAELE